MESSVEEFPTKPGSKLITKAIKSNGGLKKAVSSDDMTVMVPVLIIC